MNVTPGGDGPSELWKPVPDPDPVEVMLANTMPVYRLGPYRLRATRKPT